MIRRADDRKIEKVEHKFDADGYITVRNLINAPEELNGRGRVFSHITVAPHSGIGYHVHKGDTEIYYVLSGKAEYNDNGSITEIKAGDVLIARGPEESADYFIDIATGAEKEL